MIVEKPFGRDLASAQKLNAILDLATSTRNRSFASITFWARSRCRTCSFSALPIRFSNRSGTAISSTACRSRWPNRSACRAAAPFYEEAGAIRDVVQNHLLQVLALLTMEPPAGIDAESVRNEKVKIFKCIPPLKPARRGARTVQRLSRRKRSRGPTPKVETFAALSLKIDSWRWKGVPFYIRAGKCLPVTCTEVFVELQPPPHVFISKSAPNHCAVPPQSASFDRPGCHHQRARRSDAGSNIELLVMHDADGEEMEAYERLLGDAMRGDATLFAREDSVEAAWRIVDPVLGDVVPVQIYDPNTWGPVGADMTIVPPGGWHNPVARFGRTTEADTSPNSREPRHASRTSLPIPTKWPGQAATFVAEQARGRGARSRPLCHGRQRRTHPVANVAGAGQRRHALAAGSRRADRRACGARPATTPAT